MFLMSITASAVTYKDLAVDETRVSNVQLPTGVSGTSDTIVVIGGSVGCNGTAGCVPAPNPKTLNDGYFGECTTLSSTSTCNSCTGLGTVATLAAGYNACATKTVHDQLIARFTLTPSEISGGTLRVQMGEGTSGVTLTPVSVPAFSNGTPMTVEITWAELCRGGFQLQFNTPDPCNAGIVSGDFSQDLYIGISDSALTSSTGAKFTIKFSHLTGSDATTNVTIGSCGTLVGFCDFQILPGDEKVYITNLLRGSTGPSGPAALKWDRIRVFHAEAECVPGEGADPGVCQPGAPDFTTINLGEGALYEDIQIEDKMNLETTLSSDKLTYNMRNDTPYKFTIATVDEATIVSGFVTTGLTEELHAATPGEVVGLLDEKKCFIATAAYGSPMEPHVQVLREFRNQYLLTNTFGRWFVQTYYQYSPPLARFISENENLKAVVRWMLTPIISTARWLNSNEKTSSDQEKR